MEEGQLQVIQNYIISLKQYTISYMFMGNNINNKKIKYSNGFVESVSTLGEQYNYFREHYVNNESFYSHHEKRLRSQNIEYDRRMKNRTSLVAKLNHNLELSKSEKGSNSFRKVCNDIIGTRLIIDTSLEISELENTLKNYILPLEKVRIINSSKGTGYKAIHVYVAHELMLPIEVQIWRQCDKENNHLSHEKYKQGHFKEKHV